MYCSFFNNKNLYKKQNIIDKTFKNSTNSKKDFIKL